MRNPKLDFLRFVAILLVLFNHLLIPNDMLISPILQRISLGGWIGVDLFFVLSGFLVSGLIYQEYKMYASFDARVFLIRRGFKIYPTYYVFLFGSFVFPILFTNSHFHLSFEGLINESLFVSNYFTYNNIWLWSICVEEHFYFLLAITFYVLIKQNKLGLPSIILTYLIFLIIGILSRLDNYLKFDSYDFMRDYGQSHLRFDALFFGVLLSYFYNFKKSWLLGIIDNRYKPILVIFCLLFLATNFYWERSEERLISVINLSLNPICFGFILIVVLEYTSRKFDIFIAPFSIIGQYSYPIYLFHGFIYSNLNAVLPNFHYLYILQIVFAILIGIFMSKIIEYPFLKLRDTYFPSRSKGILQVAN